MELSLREIESFVLDRLTFVKEIKLFKNEKDLLVNGTCKLKLENQEKTLEFEVQIYPHYPLSSYNSEAIRFFNKELLHLSHVMNEGYICIHTTHNPDIRKKLIIDFHSLKNWIEKYYINAKSDVHYEHLVIEQKEIGGNYRSFMFTELDYTFSDGQYGEVDISIIGQSMFKNKPCGNFIIQSFIIDQTKSVDCTWNKTYKSFDKTNIGFFYYMNHPPATYSKFIYESWSELGKHLSEDFLLRLHNFERQHSKETKDYIPLLIGYPTTANKIHWQVALLKLGNFPFYGIPEKIDGKKTGKWVSAIRDEPIEWAISRDVSYELFFGRGALTNILTDNNILIIGIGAIGSILAKSLVQGGCKNIDICDFDIKNPENVCRSEYQFKYGVGAKTTELKKILIDISPFTNIEIIDNENFDPIIKMSADDPERRKGITQFLAKYDFIFDCSTDNNLMYALDKLKLANSTINLSITNYAAELVCGVGIGLYPFVMNQFENILDNNLEDKYEPVGCWSPTFKASYNDISTKVHLALKHINNELKLKRKLSNFVISESEDNLQLTINKY